MMTFTSLPSLPSDHPVPFTDQLRLAAAAYLARFKGASRYHTESDLRCYLAWCAERSLDPLAARRPHLELHIRLARPADLRSHRADIADLGEEHGHRVLRVCGKGTKVVLVPLPPAAGQAIDRAISARIRGPILLNSRGVRMDRHAATRRLRRLAETAGMRITRPHPHMLRHTFVTTMLDAGVDLRDVQIAARHADPRTTMRYDRARKNLDRHPNYILAAYMTSGT
jgi:integrase